MASYEYKHISLGSFEKYADTKAAVAAFNSNFSQEDLYLTYLEKESELYLRAVNISELEKLRATYSHPLIEAAITAVQRIKSYGLQRGKRIYVGYNSERKVQDRKIKETTRSKHYYSAGHNFSSHIHSVPTELEDSILEGDSLDQLSRLPDNCIDLVFTSPPYNFGLSYEEDKEDTVYWEKYFSKLFAIFDECVRVLKYGGRIVVNIQPLFSDYIPSHHIISHYFLRRKLIWKGEILWEKNNYNCKYTAWGSWKSPSGPYLKYTWEFLEVFCKGDLKKKGHISNADISTEEFKEWVVAKWSIAPERKMKDFDHPAMFPEALVERVLKLFSFQSDTILDPFNGVGTTTVVAKRLQRHYIGIDISKKYCKTAEKRLRKVAAKNEENTNKLATTSQ